MTQLATGSLSRTLQHLFLILLFLALFVAWNWVRYTAPLETISDPETSISRQKSFLRWDDEKGISLRLLLDFIQERLEAPYRERWDPWLIYTVDDHGHLWTSYRILDQYQDEKLDIERMRNRLNPADELFYHALTLWKQHQHYDGNNNDTANLSKTTKVEVMNWPFLQNAIRWGGFPFVVFVGDACIELARGDHKKDRSILPIFNLCMPIKSRNAFCFATYQNWIRAKSSPDQWINETMVEYHHQNPWKKKIPKAVWRGTPTGYLDENHENQRWRLCRIGFSNTDIMDVGFHVNPPLEQAALNMTVLGGLVGGMPEQDFMRYRAIIDVDGNFWSQRFGSLLCFNSVVVKVEPQWVDYFHPTLEPWQHYIPVKGDLSDLVEQVQFAVSDDHAAQVQSIISNANQWCAYQMVKDKLAQDFLDSLDFYVQQLDRGDANWPVLWNKKKDIVFADKNKMVERTITPLY